MNEIMTQLSSQCDNQNKDASLDFNLIIYYKFRRGRNGCAESSLIALGQISIFLNSSRRVSDLTVIGFNRININRMTSESAKIKTQPSDDDCYYNSIQFGGGLFSRKNEPNLCSDCPKRKEEQIETDSMFGDSRD